MAARSRECVCGRLLAGNAGSNPAGDIDICLCDSGVLSGRGICVGLITHPERSYRVWYGCDRETSTIRGPWPTGGCCATKNKIMQHVSISRYVDNKTPLLTSGACAT